MDEVIVFLLILIVAVAILGFLLKVLVGTIVIWGGVLMVIGGSFAWGLKSKWSLLNSHEKVSGLVTLSFNGGKVRWQTKEPAFQAFLESRKFATIGIGLGFVWIIVCTVFGLSHASRGWGIFSAFVLTPAAMPFMIQGYSSLMRLKIMDCVSQAGYHLARPGEIAIIEEKIAATSKRMGFDFPLEYSKTLQSFAESNDVALMSNLTPVENEIAKLEADANGVLASLEDAERDMTRAKAAYEEALPVVTRSHSVVLIQMLERIHNYLNTTALSDLLAARKWQDFKEAIAEVIDNLGCLAKVAKDYEPESGGKNATSQAEGIMSLERALNILDLKQGYGKTDIEDAYGKAIRECHPDRYRKLSPAVISRMDELSKDLGQAKGVLLKGIKENV